MRQWFTMKAEDGVAEILIYDEIGMSYWGDETVTAKKFDADLKALGDVAAINLRINSPGGDVFDGVAIHNMLKNHPAKITATIDGIAASIASVIAMAADKIVMPKNAFMLIHNASGFAMGGASDMRALADDLDRIDKSIVSIYASRSKKSQKRMKEIMDEDRLMDADEAIELGLADEASSPIKLAANYPLRGFRPDIVERIRAAAHVDTVAAEPEPSSEPAPPLRSEVGEGAGVAQAASAPSTDNVVALHAKAKTEGAKEHARYVNEVLDLCNLSKLPNMAKDLIAKNATVEDVRKQLLTERARIDAAIPVNPHRALPSAVPASKHWDKVVAALNARLRKK